MENEVSQVLEKSVLLKNIMVARATGTVQTDDEYGKLRFELMKHALTKDRIPKCVRTCRGLGEFWGYIQPMFSNYRDRRAYLMQEFQPLLEYLESLDGSPVDPTVSEVLTRYDAAEVTDAWRKAMGRVASDPEGAITAARTLLECICKHLLDELKEPYDDKADLPKLYGTLAKKLNLSPSDHTEQLFKQILGSCASVVEGLGSMRNRLSDAHGRGKAGVKPASRHASLAVNLAGAMAVFLVETWEARRGSPVHQAR